MKAIMAILMSMVMAIALVPLASAATSAPLGHTSGVVLQTNCGLASPGAAVSGANADPAGAGYACVTAPAYTNYVMVHPAPCPVTGSPVRAPWVMGGWE